MPWEYIAVGLVVWLLVGLLVGLWIGVWPRSSGPVIRPPTPCQPIDEDEIPRCPKPDCQMIVLACPSYGCDFDCPIASEWPHGVDQSLLPPEARWIPYF